MNRLTIIVLSIFLCSPLFSQGPKTDSGIFGHVLGGQEHLPFAALSIKGTSIGTFTDETGHYRLVNLPEGEVTLMVSLLGFKPQEKVVTISPQSTVEVNFSLEEDALNLEEVVVSADRSVQKRTEASVIVTTLAPKLFSSSQSLTLGEGLNFSPGLRLENNCQNCGFTQVRMNGLEGPYSQILINSRPIFSGLAGVYGLELIPANMIERVEVVRGGGSALFGSNAIAGTINIILKDPDINSYEVGSSYALTGVGVKGAEGSAPDYSLSFNTNMISDDRKSGLSLYGFTRKRALFDANRDGFSEIAPMKTLTLGSRLFHKMGHRSKLALDFFAIDEERDGGNKQNAPLHERDIAEAVKHDLKVAAITFEQFFREYDMLSVYASGQFLNRDSYYGANQSLKDYGNSKDKTYHVGAQYKWWMRSSSLIAGVERTGGFLLDKKLGYPDFENAVILDGVIVSVPHTDATTVADQSSATTGAFAQYEWKWEKAKITLGGRFDHYSIKDLAHPDQSTKTGNVFSPRVSVMFNAAKYLQARVSYSQGYRAPQIFDEDLHIETSGSRQVINENDPGLKQETSHSFTASLDYNALLGSVYTGLLIEGFYTRLDNPFVNEFGDPDSNGTVIYTRKNADDGAVVQGVNMEL
ncbi:MAG: TonB-dependent receptor, partial [Bacteroidales bacterium]